MKAGAGLALGIGAVVLVGGGVTAYVLLRKKAPTPAISENRDLAALQAAFGARATAGLPAATPTQATQSRLGVAGAVANNFLPGSGAAADKVAKAAVNTIKKLKFW